MQVNSLPAARGDRLRLGSWLMAAVLLAVLLAVLSCALLIESFARAHAERGATESLRQLSFDFRDALDRGMAQQFQEVKVLSQLELFQQHEQPALMRRALNQIQLGLNHFAWLGVTDAQGTVLAAGGGLLEGASVVQRPWWKGAQQGPFVGDVHAAVLLEKLLPQQTEPWRFVDFALPVRDQRGRMLGVFGAHLSWAWARQIKAELIDAAMESHQAEALVLGRDGVVLLGPRALEGHKLPIEALGDIGTALQYVGEDGRRYFAVTAATRGHGAYPGLGWTVLLRKPAELALADFYKLRSQIILVALLLIALFVPLAWLLSRRLSAPLVQLASAIKARHHLGGEPGALRVGGYREVALLSDALGELAQRQSSQDAALTELNASLEQRVAARTTELEEAMDKLQVGERRLRTITDNLPVLISYIDREQRMQFLNATFKSWMGIDPVQGLGQRMVDLMSTEAQTTWGEPLQRALAGERVSFETESVLADGGRHLMRAEYIPDLLADGSVAGVYTLATDITAAKQMEQHLQSLSRVDMLTGLPNRRELEERLPLAMARARRSGQPMGLLFLDVDKFKQINDSLGHGAGDTVLQAFGARLRECVRMTDLVARLAGDEFIVLLEGLQDEQEAELVARKILAALELPVALAQGPCPVSTSIGVVVYRDAELQPKDLLERADAALYAAKAAGRSTYRSVAAA